MEFIAGNWPRSEVLSETAAEDDCLTINLGAAMFALGQKQTCAAPKPMSAIENTLSAEESLVMPTLFVWCDSSLRGTFRRGLHPGRRLALWALGGCTTSARLDRACPALRLLLAFRFRRLGTASAVFGFVCI
jgi:hypothetical protein